MNAETNAQNRTRREHRAVAPIIATLLMVAIAVVGGILVFVFAQGFFSQTQISSAPQIESIEIIGFDARDISTQILASGTATTAVGSTAGDNKLLQGDNVIVYIKNNSPGNLTFSQVSFAGLVYAYDTSSGAVGTALPANAKYSLVLLQANAAGTSVPTLPAGSIASLVIGLDDAIKVGRDAQIKLVTSKGNVFIDAVVIGVNRG